MPNTTMLDAALSYLDLGWSLIPFKKDKKGSTIPEWKEYQTRCPTVEEVTAWWTKWPDALIAVVTGSLSGLYVVDVDDYDSDMSSYSGLTPTVTARTQSGGWHFYYKHPGKSVILKNTVKFKALVDSRGDGGVVIVPPSVGEKGEYTWAMSPFDTDIAPLPQDIFDEVSSIEKEPVDWGKVSSGATKGSRNETAAVYIGKLLHHLPAHLWESLYPSVEVWNSKARNSSNEPSPLPARELRAVWNSITKIESKNDRGDLDKITEDDSLWPNFSVSGGKKAGNSVVLETSRGQFKILMEDLYSRKKFKSQVFQRFLLILDDVKEQQWVSWLKIMAEKITEDFPSDMYEDLVIETLDSFVLDATDDNPDFLKQGLPIKFEEGFAFKASHLFEKLAKKKLFNGKTLNDLTLIFENLDIKKRRIGKSGPWVYHYVPKIDVID